MLDGRGNCLLIVLKFFEVAASSSMVWMFMWKFVKPLGFETLLVMLVSMSNDVQTF